MPVAAEPDRVADRLALLELVGTYAHTVDNHDIAGIVACFAEDARLEFASANVVVRGRADIDAYYRVSLARPSHSTGATTHAMTNTLIRFDGPDTAHLVSEAVVYLAPAGGPITVRGLTYTDRCVRSAEGWCFGDRIHRLHWMGSFDGRPAEPGMK